MKKNVAVIGYGGMGRWHANNILGSDVVKLSGIYDISPNAVLRAKEKGIEAYESLDAVLTDKSVDIIVCATPNHVHEEITIKALDAGKNVICEKPVVMTSASFDRMVQASRRNQKLLTVHQNRRWDKDFLCLKQVIDSGKLGKVMRVESRYHGSRGIPGDWRKLKECGGGMVLDWGVHLIDQMLQLLPGEIESLACKCTYITNQDVDDGFRLTLNYKDGKQGYIEVCTYNFISLPRFYMLCTEGSALIETSKSSAQCVQCKNWNEDNVKPVVTQVGRTKTMAPRDEVTTVTYEVEQMPSDVHDFYRNVCDAIDGKSSALITHAEVRRVLRIMETMFESDAQGGVLVPFAEYYNDFKY